MSPKHRETWAFRNDWDQLEFEEQQLFWRAIRSFLRGLHDGGRFPARLRVHEMRAPYRGIWSITWARDRRATFTFDTDARNDDTEVTWRRIGGHSIYEDP